MEVVVKRVWEEPEVMEIEGDLQSLQELVGGRIEVARTGSGPLLAIVNEEGLLEELPLNCLFGFHLLHGTVVFVESDGEEFVSIDHEDPAEYVRENILDAYLI